MPSSSESQRKFIFAKRGQYKTKANTPEKWKWVWGSEWETVKKESEQLKPWKYIILK